MKFLKKNNTVLALMLALVFMLGGCNKPVEDTTNKSKEKEATLVVGSFNIDVKEPENDVNEQRKLLEKSGVDIFGIQEVDVDLPRYEQDSYDPLTDFQKGEYQDSFFGQSFKKGPGGYGTAVISKFELIEKEVVPLVGTETAPKEVQEKLVSTYENLDPTDQDAYYEKMMEIWGKDGLVTKGGIEPRSYARAVFETDNKKVAFYSTHLSAESHAVRTEQLKQLKKVLDSDPVEYKILVGDFNVDEGTNEYNLFNDGYKLANGYDGTWLETVKEEDTARKSMDKGVKVKFLDNIIVSDNIEIKDTQVIKTDLSDHYPIIAKISLK